MDEEKLLEDLTPPQRQAVQHIDGPLLIIAGAGSGKTRVITRRVAYLVGRGIPPSSILAVTFTNKAAGEMKSRISSLLGRQMHDFGRFDQHWPTICTFHSLCLRILRYFAPVLGLPPNFAVFDSSDQTKLIKEALKTLEMSSTNFSPAAIHGKISDAKNRLQSAAEFAGQARDFAGKVAARVYAKYQELLDANHALDFDDLLMRAALAFREHPEILRQAQERYRYVLIDEYQDTNHAQYILAHALVMKSRNLCVVGDPDQSIYAWRGADIKNILEFEEDYPEATIIRLEQNYRSTKTILHLASTLIARNKQRKKKTLWTENDQGEKATLLICRDEHDEAQAVAQTMQDLHEQQKMPWNSMAIFYRVNALSRVMEDALRRRAIPYVMARGVEFYSRKEIKDVLAYLRVIANPRDEVNLSRIANVPTRGLGDKSLREIKAHAQAQGISTLEAMALGSSIPDVSEKAGRSASMLAGLFDSWRGKLVSKESRGVPAPEHAPDPVEDGPVPPGAPAPAHPGIKSLMEDVVRRSGLETLFKKEGGEEQSELANVAELITDAAEFDAEFPEGNLSDYLARVSLVSDTDHVKQGEGAIMLMTLHAAKGLEFPVVAIIGMEDGLLPHSRAWEHPDGMEEERRLCFVGITRAQQRLILSLANNRTVRGMGQRSIPSPFIRELPPEALAKIDRADIYDDADDDDHDSDDNGDDDGDNDFQVDSPRIEKAQHNSRWSDFRRGQLVRHPMFGLGRIAELDISPQRAVAMVDFNAGGRKKLYLEHAKLQVVG